MSEPLMSESYQRGWNDAVADMAKGLVLTIQGMGLVICRLLLSYAAARTLANTR